MRPAIIWAIRAPDVAIEELAHRGCAHQAVEGGRRKFAVLIIAALDADDHGALRMIVADALNEAAAGDVAAFERPEVDGTAIPDINRFGSNLRGEQ